MNIILKHIVKNIYKNKVKSILIILSLVVSTMVIYLNMSIKDDLMLQYKSVLQGSFQDYNYYLYKKDSATEEDSYFNSKDLDLSNVNIESSFGLNRTTGSYNFAGDLLNVHIYGGNLELMIDENLLVFEQVSSEFDPKDTHQIIISKKVAEKYEIELDDEIAVSTSTGEEKLIVGGIVQAKGLYLQESNRIMFMAPLEYVGNINGMGNDIRGLYVSIDEDDKEEDFLENFQLDNENFTGHSLIDEDSLQAELDSANQLLFIVLGGVIILVFYLNANIIKLIMETRIPVIGTFRSIGATRLKMNMILIFENVIYGLLGGILGVLFGIFMKGPIISVFSSYSNIASNLGIQYKINFRYAIYSVLLTVLLQVVISSYEILMRSRKSIRDAMFNTVDTQSNISKKRIVFGVILLIVAAVLYLTNTQYNVFISGLVFIIQVAGTISLIPIITLGISKIFSKINGKIFGAAAELGSKNLAYNKSVQASIILGTVTLSIIMTIYLTTLSINNVFNNAGKTFGGDIQATNLTQESSEYEYISDIEGVESLEFVYYNFKERKVNEDNMNLGIFGFDKEMMGIKDIEGKMGTLSKREGLIDEYYGLRHNIKVGDILNIQDNNIDNFKIEIVGYIDSSNFTSSRNVLVISKLEYIDKISNIPICIEINSSDNVDKVKDTLVNTLAGTGINIQTVDEFLEGNKSSVNSLLSMVSVILGLSVALAIFGVSINQLIGFLQRKKQFAVLYSVAMSKFQLNAMILVETANTFIISCILGGVLGVILSKTLQQILFGIGEYLNIYIEIIPILVLLFIMFILLMLTTTIYMKRISKLNVVQEIKYE